MKRIVLLIFLSGFLLTFSCQLENVFPTTINTEISSQYLLDGNLDVYLQNNQVFRYKGKPGIVSIPIGLSNLTDYENCFVLYVASGSNPETAVSSAGIRLDGQEVLNPSDFSNTKVLYTFEICNLTPQSVLEVEVMGTPGSYIDIWIEGKLKGLTVKDIDGNIYNTVVIGTQKWMVENLKTTRYCNGDLIGTTIPYNLDVSGETAPKYQWAYNGDESNVAAYGRLYTWFVGTDERNVCPCGWHVPSLYEWNTLVEKFGSLMYGGAALKEEGLTHWASPNAGATNVSGFTALPGGIRDRNGIFSRLTLEGFWLSTLDFSATLTQAYRMRYNSTLSTPDRTIKSSGFSIRCILGQVPVSPTVTTAEVSTITQTTAIIGGNVGSDGVSPITARGICYSVNSSPNINMSITSEGSGPGSFVSNITGLEPNTLYYVRAYAINSAGVAYGNEINFKTDPQ
jgi:uncharacterized protein (TIGR02145 family)